MSSPVHSVGRVQTDPTSDEPRSWHARQSSDSASSSESFSRDRTRRMSMPMLSSSQSPTLTRPFSGTPSAWHHFYRQLQQNGSSSAALQMSSKDIEDVMYQRYENLQEMRPYHLIGKSEPLTNWAKLRMPEEDIAVMPKKLRQFYTRQNELIDRYISVDRLLDSGIPVSMLRVYGDDLHQGQGNHNQRQGAPANIDTELTPLVGDRTEHSNTVMLAIYINFLVNFVLLVLKVIVAIMTRSITIMASLVDSILDFLSTVIIWMATRLVGQHDWETRHMFPAGRSRLEPIGVLVFSVLIILSFLQVAKEALTRLVEATGQVITLGQSSIAIMLFTIAVKIACWYWCRSIDSSAVQALAQDAMTDIVFNTFSLLFPLTGHYFDVWWLDPLGALLLSCYIIYSWGDTALEHINNLTGTAAEPEDRQVVLYLATRFAESIKQITALNAYHTGDRILVEVDLVLDGALNLKDSHDIGEALQYALESLPFVERVYVHLDYRTGNFTGHLDR